jgi:hypothetical protein
LIVRSFSFLKERTKERIQFDFTIIQLYQILRDFKINIDKSKYDEDVGWNGLKAYTTNTSLDNGEVIKNYGDL